MREKVAMFSFKVTWVPAKTHLIADAFSRAPLFSPQEQPELKVDVVITCLAATSQPSLDLIFNGIDEDFCTLLEDVLNGTSPSTYSRSLKADTDSLSVSEGLIVLDTSRTVLPLPAGKPVLCQPHWRQQNYNSRPRLILLAWHEQ